MNKNDNKKLNPYVFWPSISALAIFIFCGIFFQEQLGSFLNAMLYGASDTLGWYIDLFAVGTLILVIPFVFMRYGDIKIGGEDAKPDFKTHNWYFMSISGTIGTGILFWGMGEPIFHFATPPIASGVEPFSREAAVFAVSQAMWNWSFVQYALCALCAIPFAVLAYNRKKSLSFSSLVECLFGREIQWLTRLIHIIVIFCLCGAVANSMGVGLMQVGAGLNKLFGIPQSRLIWLIVAIIIAIVFILSCVSGIGRGLKRLSTVKMAIFFFVLFYVLVFGSPVFVGKLFNEAIGYMLNNWSSHTTFTNVLTQNDKWPADWLNQYWCSFFVYAPVCGMFLARMAKGRTVRQFVLVNVLVPSIFCCVWVGIFGSMTINLQTSGTLDVWEAVNTLGMQTTVFQILSILPFGTFITGLFLFAICVSFCALADPMAAVLATLSINKLSIDDEAPRKVKILLGIIITTVSYLLVASGGVNAVKGMFILVGILTSFVIIICYAAAFKICGQVIGLKNHGQLESNDEEETTGDS